MAKAKAEDKEYRRRQYNYEWQLKTRAEKKAKEGEEAKKKKDSEPTTLANPTSSHAVESTLVPTALSENRNLTRNERIRAAVELRGAAARFQSVGDAVRAASAIAEAEFEEGEASKLQAMGPVQWHS
jgi:hypothetical protein